MIRFAEPNPTGRLAYGQPNNDVSLVESRELHRLILSPSSPDRKSDASVENHSHSVAQVLPWQRVGSEFFFPIREGYAHDRRTEEELASPIHSVSER
jgi:hypothetical protein